MANVDFAGGRGASALRRFVAGTQRRVFGGRVLGAALRAALVTAAPALVLAWWLPSLRMALSFAVAAVLVPVVIVSAARAHLARRRMLVALGQRLAASPAAATAHDELLTWLEFDARAAGHAARPALLDWLEHDVAARLTPDERRQFAAASRPSLGRFAWLLPLVLVLLLAWLLAEWLAPPWSGVLGGNPPPPPPGTSGGGGGGNQGDGEPQSGDGEPQDQPQQPEQSPPPEAAPPSPPEQQSDSPQPPPPEPSPLLELPEQQRFVVPEFVDDGPTRRARMRAAEIEGNGGAAAPPPSAPRNVGEQPAPEQPAPREQQFERAAEQALRSRHVPESERAIVRRFFDKLQQKGR